MKIALTIAAMCVALGIDEPKWVPSPNHSATTRAKRLIGIHTTQGHERDDSAEGTARNWFALPKSYASAQYVIGPASIVQCVKDDRAAWHAGKANGYTIGVELTGKAEQTGPAKDLPLTEVGEWFDAQSKRMLDRAARWCAILCIVHDIEVQLLDDEQLHALHAGDNSISGFCGHVDLSRTIGGTHWDPGPNFPWLQFMLAVRAHRDALLELQA